MTPYMKKIPRRHETSEGYQQKLSIKSSTFNSPCLAQLDQIRYLIHSQKRPILLEGLHIDSPSQSRMCFGDAWQAEHLTQVKGNFVSIRKSQWWRSDCGNESE
ncbi:hypothetical protein TNCV_4711631 [Trichonephila clavipes]|nr:hypothetical protein TNCV_4711501 [Trichonephila clavipes]GFS73260.1 hypothetical protein TNCV_4711511 [Trichonephila clavipes]GFS73277.1 hypothetical protein TNCV_4711631 [Trichonephila clavipes]